MPTNSPIISNEKIVETVPRANSVGRMRWVIEAYTGLMIIERKITRGTPVTATWNCLAALDLHGLSAMYSSTSYIGKAVSLRSSHSDHTRAKFPLCARQEPEVR